jgi:hypothetical protein
LIKSRISFFIETPAKAGNHPDTLRLVGLLRRLAAGLVDELQQRLLGSVAERFHSAEMEFRQSEMSDRRFGRGGAAGAVELFERAIHMVVDSIALRHFNRSPDSEWVLYSDSKVRYSVSPGNYMDQVVFDLHRGCATGIQRAVVLKASQYGFPLSRE